MSPRELVEYLAGEWAVIRSAPVTFLVAIAIVTAAIWWLTSQLYAARFDGQKEAISALEGRLKARDDDLVRKASQIADLEKRASAAPTPQAVARDPNGMCQASVKVGVAHGAMRNIGAGSVSFALLDATGDFNSSLDFDYQDLTLHLDRSGTVASVGGMGIIDRRRFGEVSCRIVSRRQ